MKPTKSIHKRNTAFRVLDVCTHYGHLIKSGVGGSLNRAANIYFNYHSTALPSPFSFPLSFPFFRSSFTRTQ